MRRMNLIAAVACIFGLMAGGAEALTIDAVFDSSILSSPEGSQIVAAEKIVADQYKMFADTETVTIYIKTLNLGAPGGASWVNTVRMPYQSYVDLLKYKAAENPDNSVLNSAVNNLVYGNSAQFVDVTPAQYNMLTYPDDNSQFLQSSYAYIDSWGVYYNGMVGLDANLESYFAATPGVSAPPELLIALTHEFDEVLGIGGWGSNIMPGIPADMPSIAPLDLYRYSAFQTPSFTDAHDAVSYFSVDGGKTPID